MADITISSGTIRMANAPRVPGFIAAFPAGEDWWLYSYRSPLQVAMGSAGPETGMNPYMLVPLTPAGTNPTEYTYPQFTIQSTEDAVINPSGARWTFALMTNNDVPRFVCYLANLVSIRIPSSPSTNNLTDIAGFNLVSLPPVTNGDRLILGDLYAENGIFSGTVTAVQFVGGGAGLTGVTGATGGVSNTGSTTIGADTDVDGVGIISLQTRNIERFRINNDGSADALGALGVAGLATLSLGASIPGTKQISWTTANVAAPSASDNTTGARIRIYDAAAPDHVAVGLESGAGWFQTADANAWKFYFAAVLKYTLTKSSWAFAADFSFAAGNHDFDIAGIGQIQIGDGAGAANSTYMQVNDALKRINFNSELTQIVSLAGGNGTGFTVDDANELIEMTAVSALLNGRSIGFLEIAQNSKSAAYTLVLADAGKHILHPSADTTARIFTIPANASVAYPIGTILAFVNQNAAGVITIAITTDTMRLAGAGTTGSRTLAANGVATAVKVTATEWIVSGTGLT